MANPKHLSILKNGQDEWGKWRLANEFLIPDLSDIDLANIRTNFENYDFTETNFNKSNLSYINFRNAIFRYSTLLKSNLYGGNLSRADLSFAKMLEADLAQANLQGAQLINTDLSKSILSGADLSYTVFVNSNLSETNFSHSNLDNTVIINSNLSNCIGLDNCYHRGSTIVDRLSLMQSSKIPLVFLKECGIEDELIKEYQYGSRIILEFAKNRWEYLTFIELALRMTLGEDYIVEKSSDNLVVKLDRIEQIHDAFHAIFGVLLLVKTNKGESTFEINKISIQPKDSQPETISKSELFVVMDVLASQMKGLKDEIRELKSIAPKNLDVVKQTKIEIVRQIPLIGPIIGVWVERFLKGEKKTLEIYKELSKLINRLDKFKKD